MDQSQLGAGLMRLMGGARSSDHDRPTAPVAPSTLGVPTTTPLQSVHQGILLWLNHLQVPSGASFGSWEEALRDLTGLAVELPHTHGGFRVCYAVTLATHRYRYLLTISEGYEPPDPEFPHEIEAPIYILSVHVGWDKQEWIQQQRVDRAYTSRESDPLKSRHTIWVQNFRSEDTFAAMNTAAHAILNNELVAVDSPSNTDRQVLHNLVPRQVSFPDPDQQS